MMQKLHKGMLMAICLLCALLLSGCYADNDPWPSAGQLGGNDAATSPAATAVPATDVPAVQPTAEPPPEDAVDIAPNFNG